MSGLPPITDFGRHIQVSILAERYERPCGLGDETAACFANVSTMMGGRSTKNVTQGYLC